MRKLLLCRVVWLGLVGITLAEERPAVSRYIRAYTGPEGIRVWVLRMVPESKHAALLQIEGIDHDWDRLILKVDVRPMQSGEKFFYLANGKRYEVFTNEGGTVELLVPGMRERVRLLYNADLSDKGNAQHFLTAYLDQKPSKP